MTISKMTGPDSPSKVAIRKAYTKALEKHKKDTVTTAMKDAKTNADVTKALIRASVPENVVDTLEKEKDNEDLQEALDEAKKNPEIADKLAKKLVTATDDDDVADAIQEAKTEAKLVKTKDPKQRVQLQEEGRIAVCKIRTDIKARKITEDSEKALEDADSEEAIEKAAEALRHRAEALRGQQEVELAERARKAKVDMAKKAAEERKKINMRIADTLLRGRFSRIVKRSNWNVRRIGYQIGRTLGGKVTTPVAIKRALETSLKQSKAAAEWLKNQVGDLKKTLEKSGASEKMQRWVKDGVDKAETQVDDALLGISICAKVTNQRLDTRAATDKVKKEISKKLYLSKTKAAVDEAITEAKTRWAKIYESYSVSMQVVIATGKNLPGERPKTPFGPKNAMDYLTSPEFLEYARKGQEMEAKVHIDRAMASFGRRKAAVYRSVRRREIQDQLKAARAKILEARKKVLAVRDKRNAHIVKLKALRAKNAWLRKQEDDEDNNNPAAKIAVLKRNAAAAMGARVAAIKANAEIKNARIAKIRARLLT
jgi:hypothetical protein